MRMKNEPYVIDKKLIIHQKETEIEKRRVYFPYEPYEVQVQYIKKVFNALDSKTNAVLESPTGTGKTLCLLTSALTWIDDHYTKTGIKTKIIYMSRTHSQLKQVQKELEKTCFRPNMAVFASRDQLCIKDQFSRLNGREKIEACSKGIKLNKKIKKMRERNPTE